MKKYTNANRLGMAAIIAVLVVAVTFTNSCKKCNPANKKAVEQATTAEELPVAAVPLQQNAPQTGLVTIANIRKSDDGSTAEVMFNELAELFTVQDATVLATLQEAFQANEPVNIKFDPWNGIVLYSGKATAGQAEAARARKVVTSSGSAIRVGGMSDDAINNSPAMAAVLNTTTSNLTNVIPDMATAQLMFNYITKQCCALSGSLAIDHCISFQYCQDGCYARAHKMCWILNNTYKYETHKIFSFANAGSDRLSVKCQKWRGCCVTWWYHVAPLVNIKTASGVKAYVFDPAMFDQPVLLATWLHAQENPACSSTPHVTMINIQPTSSYTPSGYSGYLFGTDPFYTSTNSTLISYAPLHTCY